MGSVVDVVSGTTVRTRINNPCARTLELLLLVRSGVFSFLFVSESTFFGAFVDPFPEEDISDYPAHGPIIRALTVSEYSPERRRSLDQRYLYSRNIVVDCSDVLVTC